jgi:hypothetical protein
MARVLKKPGLLVAEPEIVKPQPPAPPAGITPRRRLVPKNDEHPAVAQFSSHEAKERVRARLASNPNLLPSAFSHRPGREGCELTGIEAVRVMSGKSIHVTGFGFTIDDRDGDSMCLRCYLKSGRPSTIPGKGYTIALFDPGTREKTTKTCMTCGDEFKGER